MEIQPLTCVHVGDGEKLRLNMDSYKDKKNIYVLDLDKLAAHIKLFKEDGTVDRGEFARLESRIIHSDVSSLISNGASNKISENVLSSLCERVIEIRGSLSSDDIFILTQIKDAFGRPFLPGSSIKGAIRTAVLAPLALAELENKGKKHDEAGMEKQLFRRDKNDLTTDYFRFLRISDAYFSQKDLGAVKIRALNEPAPNKQKRNALEVIASEVNSEFHLSVDWDKLNLFCGGDVPKHLDFMLDPNKLFNHVNENTLDLLDYDVDFIKRNDLIGNSGELIDKYEDFINKAKEWCKQCKPGECVLRLGMGIGKTYTTGMWATETNKNTAKTRAYYTTDDKGKTIDLLGFVKLRIKSVK